MSTIEIVLDGSCWSWHDAALGAVLALAVLSLMWGIPWALDRIREKL